MQPFDLRSKGSRKPVSWENGKTLPSRSHAGSLLLLVPARPLILRRFAPSRPVRSHYGSPTNPNPPPKSMESQISMISGEYKVRTITGDEFDVIYTRSSATVKGCLSRFRRMFENSDDEWVTGLDVEYTTVLGLEKDLKDEERKKPAVIQVCVHDLCLVYHICHADVECLDFKNFLESNLVKFVTVDFTNDKEVLGQIGLVVGNPFDLQKNWLLPSGGQPSMLTLAGAMVHPSYGILEKPQYMFHRYAWQRNVLDIDHIHYAAMDGWLPLFQYLQGLDEEQEPSVGSSKEVSAKRKRDKDEVEDVGEDSE
ncbi:hypothetical protein CFC21_088542 [Triticum aestivum]|uniref:3'-5' exonuclease domain-containing protein n=2 Tax=Triticum aestivum TaxID=4565 RepID=A0A9R1IK23_WHEAT|nr:hypothetical protein CFC21_088542 [Triticum aestivum]